MFEPIQDNQVRYQSNTKAGHVESYFLKLNDPRSPKALWLKFTLLSPQKHPQSATADLWAISFDGDQKNIAAKRSWSLYDSEVKMTTYPLRLGESELRPGYTRGSVEKSGAKIEWELSFNAGSPPMHLFPFELMYKAPLPKSKTVTPYPNVRFEGWYRVNGVEVKVSGWPGTQGHNWGREHAFLYVWSHCNAFFGEDGELLQDTYFEGLSAKIKIGPVLSPYLSSAWLRYRGVDIPFTLRELTRAGTTSEIEQRGPYRWSFYLDSPQASLEGTIEATQSQMCGLYYVNPDGQMTYCLNSKIANMRLLLRPKNSGSMILTSRAAALEIGTRDPNHGVTMVV
jgi:hypothetical protein